MRWTIQIKRYLTVGLGSAATDLSAYSLLVYFTGLSPEAANLISRPCGGLFSFTGNKLWTFERREAKGTGRQFARFWIVWFVSYAASELLVWLFDLYFTHHPTLPRLMTSVSIHLTGFGMNLEKLLPKLCAESCIAVGLFLTHRFWTFRQH